MQSSHIHSYIKPVTYPPSTAKKAAHVTCNHTHILSHFFLPPHSRSTPVGFMQFKLTKTSSVVHPTPLVNKLKHPSYDDPAFSADPTANPLCAAGHDISSWITEPPKGHPVIRPREFHADVQSGEVALIQPPNSPVYLNAQAHPVNPMTQFTESTLMSSPPTSVPDLSSTASSASDSSLPTPTASRLSLGTSQTTMSSAPPANIKKRIGLPFFRRKLTPAPPSRPINTSLASATNAISSASPSQIQRQTVNAQATASMPSQAFRGYHQHATGGARELDMIDELDESNPSGVALHHGGPYEAIQKVTASRAQVQRTPYATNQQSSEIYRRKFRFDVPLNLSPGQILPHAVTAYYRPQAAPVSNVQERVDFGTPVVNHAERQREPSAADRGMDSVAKQYSVANPTFAHGPRGASSGQPLHRHTSSEPLALPDNKKFQVPNAHPPKASPPPAEGTQHTTASNVSVVAGNVDYDPTGGKRLATRTLREQDRYTYDDPRKQRVADIGNPQMPRTAPAYMSKAEEHPQGFPGGFQQPTPQHLERIGPPINQDEHRQQDPRPGLVHSVQSAPPHLVRTVPPINQDQHRQQDSRPGLVHGVQSTPPRLEHIGLPINQDQHRQQDSRPGLLHGVQSAPPHLARTGPPVNQDQHRQQDPRPGLVHGVQSAPPHLTRTGPPVNQDQPRQQGPRPGLVHGVQSTPPHLERMGPPINQDQHRQQDSRPGLHGVQSAPPHLARTGSSINQDQHRQQDPRPGPVHSVLGSHPSVASSSSTFRSGASSVMTAATNASSVSSSRNRILPRQLVMPAPLAKAAASSRPLPTQPQQHWQNTTQHRIRFGDGSEIELPVTNTDAAIPMPSISESPHVMKPHATKPPSPTRTLSMSHSNGKLKKRPSFRGPEPPEIVARLAIAPGTMYKSKYMEPPPTIPEAPRIERVATNASVKQMKRLLSKKKSTM